jgi:DNA-binding response OmpR family regulator
VPEILIVEDERLMRDALAGLFGDAGFAVRLAKDAAAGIASFRDRPSDVVLLDVMMPGMDGFGACRAFRALDPLVPIVFHTALDAAEDKLRALEWGADDYVLKTDPPAELLARVRRALLRLEAFGLAKRRRESLTLGSVTVDLSLGTVDDGRSAPVSLTRTETDLLRLLASRRGQMFSCGAILDALRGEGFVCDDNTVYVHVHNVRRKLGPAASWLESDRRAGYRLRRGEDGR